MGIADLKDALADLSRPLVARQVIPSSERVLASELNVSDSFRVSPRITGANGTHILRPVRSTLEACIQMENRLRELEPPCQETGYVDGYIYGMEMVLRTRQNDLDEVVFDCIKIGRSVNPSLREGGAKTWLAPFSEIRDAYPFLKMREAFRLWVHDYVAVERAVHESLSYCRLLQSHEWFRCFKEEALTELIKTFK